MNENYENEEPEIKIFHNALEFSKLKVRDCMVPRNEIEALEASSSLNDLLQKFIESGYSKILVYEETIDNIIGYISSKELFKNPEIDLVLMDIMMPEMDGYEAMQEIRKDKRFTRLPIIALTAKAMKDDRQKCIDAGANDYLTKPFDPGKLISMLRVWLYR